MTAKIQNLRQYVGKHAVKTSKTDSLEFTVHQDVLAHQSALALAQLFDGIVGHKGYATTRLKHHMSTFLSIIQRLETLKSHGISVRQSDYVLAHKWFYGEGLQPWHLMTSQSHDIYIAFMRNKSAKQVKFTKKQYENYNKATIKHLADLRGESEEETRESMLACGLL